jgi:hypothetical protein
MQALESLTMEQYETIEEHKKEFMDFILNNDKHREKDLKVTDILSDITWIYEKAGLKKKPKFILIAHSSKEGKLMLNYLFNILGYDNLTNCKVFELIFERVVAHINEQFKSQVIEKLSNVSTASSNQDSNEHKAINLSKEGYDFIFDHFCSQVSYQIEGNIYDKIHKQVQNQGYNVSSQVRTRIINRVGSQIYDQTGYQITEESSNRAWYRLEREDELGWEEHGLGLAFNSGWLWIFSFIEKIGFIKNNDFSRYLEFLKKGIWSMLCFDEWCIVTDFPKKIHMDAEKRLHSIDGSSVEWRNGDKNYFINGVSFQRVIWEKVITDNVDPFEILKIQNQEQRQAALSVIPLQNILKRTKASCISSFTRANPPRRSKEYVVEYQKLNFNNQVKLFEVYGGYFNFEENVKIVSYFCPSTGREYFDFVPPHINRASEAMAWKFDVKEEDYLDNFVVET